MASESGFPKAIPEIPVSNVEKAAEYYVNVLGFQFDWGNDEGGIGGISQGECRMFLTNAPFRQHYGNGGTVMVIGKSGSNQFHGSAFEFFRNEALNARNLFAPTGPKPESEGRQPDCGLGLT